MYRRVIRIKAQKNEKDIEKNEKKQQNRKNKNRYLKQKENSSKLNCFHLVIGIILLGVCFFFFLYFVCVNDIRN